MLYDYLYEFSVVAQSESLAKAALKLAISQPALGRHMDALESEIGSKLLVRTSTGVRLTDGGRYVLNVALDMVEMGDDVRHYFAKLRSGKSQFRYLRIGGLTRSNVCDELLRRAHVASPSLSGAVGLRNLSDMSLESTRAELEACNVDIVLAFRSTIERERLSEGFHCVRLAEAPLDAIVEPDHLFSDRTEVALEELEGYPIGHLRGRMYNADPEWEELKRLCAAAGFNPRSKTAGFNMAPAWGQWSMPDCVLVFSPDLHNTAKLEKVGKCRLEISNARFEVLGVCRIEDEQSRALLDDAGKLAAASNWCNDSNPVVPQR